MKILCFINEFPDSDKFNNTNQHSGVGVPTLNEYSSRGIVVGFVQVWLIIIIGQTKPYNQKPLNAALSWFTATTLVKRINYAGRQYDLNK